MARNAVLSSTGPFAGTDGGIGLDRAAWGARFLQPQTLGSVIRNSFTIYVRNWTTICLIYIVPLLPLAVLRHVLAEGGHSGWAGLVSFVQLMISILVGAALIVAVSDVCLGLKPNLRRLARKVSSIVIKRRFILSPIFSPTVSVIGLCRGVTGIVEVCA